MDRFVTDREFADFMLSLEARFLLNESSFVAGLRRDIDTPDEVKDSGKVRYGDGAPTW